MDQVIHKQIQAMQESFQRLEDLESKVSNIKSRIQLIQNSLGIKQKSIHDIIKTQPPKQNTHQEMSDLRSKLKPKSIYQQMSQTDKELDEALQEAFNKMK
jgi:hypothetical protein